MNTPHRLQAKLFFREDAAVPMEEFVPLFHRWIQEQSLDDLLIDVHDYSHVYQGPGILLVAHEGDYSIDEADGRPGLIYRRKRTTKGTLRDAFLLTLRNLVDGALRVEADEEVLGKTIRFRTDEVEIGVPDRLRFPNDGTTAGRVRDALLPVLQEFLGNAATDIVRVENDPREPLILRADLPGNPPLQDFADALKMASETAA